MSPLWFEGDNIEDVVKNLIYWCSMMIWCLLCGIACLKVMTLKEGGRGEKTYSLKSTKDKVNI